MISWVERLRVYAGGVERWRERPSAKQKSCRKNNDMSTLAKWNPFRDLEDIQNRLSPWFGRIALRGSGDVCAKDLTATPLRSGLFRSFAPWRPPGSLREAYLLARCTGLREALRAGARVRSLLSNHE